MAERTTAEIEELGHELLRAARGSRTERPPELERVVRAAVRRLDDHFIAGLASDLSGNPPCDDDRRIVEQPSTGESETWHAEAPLVEGRPTAAHGWVEMDRPLDGVVRLSICNPSKRNALDLHILDAIAEALSNLDGARCVVLPRSR